MYLRRICGILTLGAFLLICLGCYSNVYRLRVVVTPGFVGDLRVVESASVRRGADGTYTVTQLGNTLLVPVGFTGSGQTIPFTEMVECKDTSGRVLSRGMRPPSGQVTLNGIGADGHGGKMPIIVAYIGPAP